MRANWRSSWDQHPVDPPEITCPVRPIKTKMFRFDPESLRLDRQGFAGIRKEICLFNGGKRPGPGFEPSSRDPQSLRITTTLSRRARICIHFEEIKLSPA